MAKPGDVIDGKYDVLHLIGEGGMSRVWLASDHRLNKLWAVKEIKKSARDANNSVVVQSLIAEANLMKRLDHPALPRIVDIIEDGRTIYVIMDYVDGNSLSRVLAERGQGMDEADVIEWGIQLCDVLEYLHTRTPPVVYRDMKPGNIMLREDGTVKLIDFGIAREYKEYSSSDTVNLGTRGYAAPEQFSRDEQSDARTDVYGLGITLYHLVTGHGPAEEPFEIRPIRQWNARFSEGLEYIIQKATQQSPEKRYQSCAEMRYDLEHHYELTQEYRSILEDKVQTFKRWCICAVASLAIGGLCLGISTYFKNSTFEAHMEKARASSTQEVEGGASDAEREYMEAIDVEPSRVEPYSRIANEVYKEDSDFTVSENDRWKSLISDRGQEIQNDPGYAQLCFDAGILYYVYFDYGDQQTRGLQAAQWFQYAMESYDDLKSKDRECTLTEEDRRAAEVYRTIGEFYKRLSQGILEGSEGDVYSNYWDALQQVNDSLDESDATMVKLRLYDLVHEAVGSSTYLNGFRRTGVTRDQAQSLLDSTYEDAKRLTDEAQQNRLSAEMYDNVVSGYESACRNIDNVYGNVAAKKAEQLAAQEAIG